MSGTSVSVRPASPTDLAPSLEPISAVFHALAHPHRVLIVWLLRDGEVCVCDLVAAIGLPQSSVSRQLAVLREAGLVEARRDGRWMHYRLGTQLPPPCDAVVAALVQAADPALALRVGAAPGPRCAP